jgi:hypothetical protein
VGGHQCGSQKWRKGAYQNWQNMHYYLHSRNSKTAAPMCCHWRFLMADIFRWGILCRAENMFACFLII